MRFFILPLVLISFHAQAEMNSLCKDMALQLATVLNFNNPQATFTDDEGTSFGSYDAFVHSQTFKDFEIQQKLAGCEAKDAEQSALIKKTFAELDSRTDQPELRKLMFEIKNEEYKRDQIGFNAAALREAAERCRANLPSKECTALEAMRLKKISYEKFRKPIDEKYAEYAGLYQNLVMSTGMKKKLALANQSNQEKGECKKLRQSHAELVFGVDKRYALYIREKGNDKKFISIVPDINSARHFILLNDNGKTTQGSVVDCNHINVMPKSKEICLLNKSLDCEFARAADKVNEGAKKSISKEKSQQKDLKPQPR